MLQPWESTPLQKFLDKFLDIVLWVIQAAFWLSLFSIPLLIAIGLIHFVAKYW